LKLYVKPHELARSKHGYLDAATERGWVLWQRAWHAAMSIGCPILSQQPDTANLTEEEIDFRQKAIPIVY
jgi:hypothetical protein